MSSSKDSKYIEATSSQITFLDVTKKIAYVDGETKRFASQLTVYSSSGFEYGWIEKVNAPENLWVLFEYSLDNIGYFKVDQNRDINKLLSNNNIDIRGVQ